jgi:hypothetical protein
MDKISLCMFQIQWRKADAADRRVLSTNEESGNDIFTFPAWGQAWNYRIVRKIRSAGP